MFFFSSEFYNFPAWFLLSILVNVGLYFISLKYKSGIKIPGFHQKLSKIKKKEKNVFVHTTKCLEAKKSSCVFHTPKNNVLACILVLITSLLKSREHWSKLQKQTKILFCLTFSFRGTTLHVMRIPNIKFFFSDARMVRF